MASLDIRWMALFADIPADSHGRAITFWAAVTGARPGEPFGDQEEHHPLLPDAGDRYVWLQRIDDGEPRWHLDLYVRDPGSAAAIATDLGARVTGVFEWWTACESPGGKPFCLVRETPEARIRPSAPSWPGGRSELDQVCIDVPADDFDAEVRFWTSLTGWDLVAVEPAEFRRVAVPESLPLRILLQRLGDDDGGGVRAHADLSADNRVAEVSRQVNLGATVVRESQHWTVLRDVCGLTYCVTDRKPHG